MNKPQISIIIPTYGRPQFIQETLQSVATQSYLPSEVIVVDDCSPTPVGIPSGLPVDVRVFTHLRNQGPGAARNTGAAHATGEWIVFLDDDDLLMPDRLLWAVEEMGDAYAHVCDVEVFYPDGRCERPNPRVYSGDMRPTFARGRPPLLGQVVFRHKDLLQFDPALRVSEDVEWWLRMSDRAIFSWNPAVGLRCRAHTGERPGMAADTRYRCRAVTAIRHAPSVDRVVRARLYGNVSATALLSGWRIRTVFWSIRALFAYPTVINVKRLLRSVWLSTSARSDSL